MVHYIRFLKPPRAHDNHGSSALVKALITITTDLGDDFLPCDLKLKAVLIQGDNANSKLAKCRDILWKTGMRVLWIEIAGEHVSSASRLRVIEAAPSEKEIYSDTIALEEIPLVLGCSSNIIDPLRNVEHSGRSERRLMLQPGNCLSIEEDIGESIARHVWDAGIVMAAFLTSLQQSPNGNSEEKVLGKVLKSSSSGLKVLELGSGSGIVGIAFAQLWPQCQIILTDLAEAMDILKLNISKAIPAAGTTLSAAILDWDQKLPAELEKVSLDIVLVSDCTYNSDSIPALVKTLSAIASNSPTVIVLLSLKVRHTSEAVLFGLLSAAGFWEFSHTSLALPCQGTLRSDHGYEMVETYAYRRWSDLERAKRGSMAM